ncbi:NAD(P)-binding oxidoreductase, partial [Enterococcus faecium]
LVKKENVSYVSFDLTWSVEKMTEAFKGIDVLIFAAGSQGKNLLQVDLDGAIKTVIAAENAHVSRYLMVSAVYADEPAKWPESMTDYYITKHYADEWLKRTNLDFVILQPVTLTNDEEVTSIQLTKPNEKASKTITRSTVAAVLAALVEETDISRTTLVLSEGSKELNTAFQEWAKEE